MYAGMAQFGFFISGSFIPLVFDWKPLKRNTRYEIIFIIFESFIMIIIQQMQLHGNIYCEK